MNREQMELLHNNFKLHRLRGDNLPHLLTPKEQDKGRESISRVLSALHPKIGVEIGTRKGISAVIWADANPEMRLYCVDPWLGRQEKFYPEAQERLKGKNVEIIRAKSMEALSKFKDGSLDFVHIDGNHEFDFVVTDIVFWNMKLHPGGLMAIHDYIEFYKGGVIEAVKAYTHCHSINPWFVTRDRLPTVIWFK